MVIPSNERKVLSLFAFNELKANEKLSNINRANNICQIYLSVKIPIASAFLIYLLVLIFLKDYIFCFVSANKLSIFQSSDIPLFYNRIYFEISIFANEFEKGNKWLIIKKLGLPLFRFTTKKTWMELYSG